MVDQLSSFAAEVTRVAREVGTEGKLGGQAEVEGVSGTWKRLTENVNELASNLTNQLRAIAEVATAVARGDLTRQIAVDASGEVAELKDNINQMVANLRETTRANREQDWLKTNLARITGLVQGRRDLADVADVIMRELTPWSTPSTAPSSSPPASMPRPGCDWSGPTATGRAPTCRRRSPSARDSWARPRRSAAGSSSSTPRRTTSGSPPGSGRRRRPASSSCPCPSRTGCWASSSSASFTPFTEVHLDFLDQLMELVGVSLNTILANSRTEELLGESQRLAAELQDKQAELQSQQEALEERAEQLSLSSRYKSEFLANMSHELRTPLNSLLILARLLAENTDGNLTGKQVEFARTIHSSGTDLLQLINDILDLSKVEAGKMDVHVGEVSLTQLVEYVEATFRPLTTERSLGFELSVSPELPPKIRTDEQRLQQILRNLLSNAVKFTAEGEVRLVVEPATPAQLSRARLDGHRMRCWRSRSSTPASASPRTSCGSSSTLSSRPMARPAAATAAPASVCRSAERSPACSAARSRRRSRVDEGSTFTLLLPVDAFTAGVVPVQGGTPLEELTPRPSREVGAARRRGVRRQEGAHRRRRRPQRVRVDQRAGAAGDVGRLRRERPRGHRGAGTER